LSVASTIRLGGRPGKARVDADHPREAARDQPGSGDEDHGERDLADDEQPAQPPGPAAGRGAAGAQRVGDSAIRFRFDDPNLAYATVVSYAGNFDDNAPLLRAHGTMPSLST
jgi:hypothetical protein